MAWYVVYHSKELGVYATWATCHAQVIGFPNCCYKGFPSMEEAVASYMEFKGHEDDKAFVKPAATVVAKTSWLFLLCMVQSFMLAVLIFYIVKRGKNCL
jgi:viroplasmin and RNaseH domain-containing protein